MRKLLLLLIALLFLPAPADAGLFRRRPRQRIAPQRRFVQPRRFVVVPQRPFRRAVPHGRFGFRR